MRMIQTNGGQLYMVPPMRFRVVAEYSAPNSKISDVIGFFPDEFSAKFFVKNLVRVVAGARFRVEENKPSIAR